MWQLCNHQSHTRYYGVCLWMHQIYVCHHSSHIYNIIYCNNTYVSTHQNSNAGRGFKVFNLHYSQPNSVRPSCLVSTPCWASLTSSIDYHGVYFAASLASTSPYPEIALKEFTVASEVRLITVGQKHCSKQVCELYAAKGLMSHVTHCSPSSWPYHRPRYVCACSWGHLERQERSETVYHNAFTKI